MGFLTLSYKMIFLFHPTEATEAKKEMIGTVATFLPSS